MKNERHKKVNLVHNGNSEGSVNNVDKVNNSDFSEESNELLVSGVVSTSSLLSWAKEN